MSLSLKADSDTVLSKTYSMVQFKQHYIDYLKLFTEQLIQYNFSVNTNIQYHFFAKIIRL